MLGLPPLHRRLRFDFVDFFKRLRPLVRLGRQAALEQGRALGRRLGTGQLTPTQLAQHFELAFAHKVTATLALNQLFEHQLAVTALLVRISPIQIRPVGYRIAHEPDNLGQQATVVFFCHALVSHFKWGAAAREVP